MDTVNWGEFCHRYFNKLLPNIVFAENLNTITKKLICRETKSHPIK